MKNTVRNNMGMNDNTQPNATADMLADLGVSGADTDALRALLNEVAGLASEVPQPSDDVQALLGGAIPLRSRRRTLAFVAAAAGALALGGVSAAAAANRLPDRVQEVVADATGGVVPHPAKPTSPREREVPPPNDDAPGHILNKPKATKTPKPDVTKAPNTNAPGQVQKSTKPDPTAPGPAHPADPGSHGRAHNPDKSNSSDNSDNDDDDTRGGDSGKSHGSDKPQKD